MQKTYQVGILLFDDVDVLDFAGPFEVFNLTVFQESDVNKLFTNQLDSKPFHVSTVSEDGQTVTAHNGLRVTPDYSFGDHPAFDIIIVPGGPLKAMQLVQQNEKIIHWINVHREQLVASVCTGAFFLGQAGLLSGKQATTNRVALSMLEHTFEDVEVIRGVKYVDAGQVITSAGISAGIQMSLHVIERLFDEEMAKRTARTIEIDE
ncbi:DJ-1/PfpI family protein [Geomicrobium sp. JCM 19055]|uniref:DJ-1/PfpI family protein n=1 Tax=Geomicrobium sp. JCM 19055 TaxID=1460649 RepID=UPI00045ED75F|nr:DJ-1/PfpI family protein [Geomicrobium sp. JCM 19055]GAK01240.1 ThiJ/PfpI family protein [Geomicrobium sp. JCM 19055]